MFLLRKRSGWSVLGAPPRMWPCTMPARPEALGELASFCEDLNATRRDLQWGEGLPADGCSRLEHLLGGHLSSRPWGGSRRSSASRRLGEQTSVGSVGRVGSASV